MVEVSASEQIDAIIKKASDWRSEALSQLRVVVVAADPDVVEEVKWKKPARPEGVPVWSHDGIICTGDLLKDPKRLFNTPLDSTTVRAIDLRENERIDETALKAVIIDAVSLNTSKVRKRYVSGRRGPG
jgi:hypothetical protein